MPPKPASEVLYDSEATLRLVDSALDGLRDAEPAEGGATAPAPTQAPGRTQALDERMRSALEPLVQGGGELGLVGLSQLLMRGYAEIVSVLNTLRESRNVLERTAVDRIQHTHAKLREVSDATELAATNVLDGLDRATNLVDELDRLAAGNEDAAEVRGRLRDELFGLIGHMQFQDITTQQLNYASSVLGETEQRLAQLAAVFDPATVAGGVTDPGVVAPTDGVTFDPHASTMNAEERQAVADEVFTKKPRL
jgi:hypothetical protein